MSVLFLDTPLSPDVSRREQIQASPNHGELSSGMANNAARDVRASEAVGCRYYWLRKVGRHFGLRVSTIRVIASRETPSFQSCREWARHWMTNSSSVDNDDSRRATRTW